MVKDGTDMVEKDQQTQLCEREVALNAKVLDFFNQKERVKYYNISGTIMEDWGAGEFDVTVKYSDEDVTRIKELLSEAFVHYYKLPERVNSMEEIREKDYLWTLKGQIKELDDLLFIPCEDEYHIDVLDIDFEHPVYYYRMSCRVFNTDKQKMEGPFPFRIILSDEEYIYLLTKQMKYRNDFTFNRLLEMNPDLALKINRWAEGAYYGFHSLCRLPFLICMDEVLEDICQLDGPAPFDVCLYENDDFDFSTCTTLFLESRKVRVVEERMNNRYFTIDFYTLKDISADELLARLGASDYKGMMKMFRKRFSGKSALVKFRNYLEAEKMHYVEDVMIG